MADYEGLSISFEEVLSTSEQIDSLNNNLTEGLSTIKNQINSLQDTWQSDAGENIRDKINKMQNAFDRYREIIEKYAKFLRNTTVETYTQVEKANNSNADQFA